MSCALGFVAGVVVGVLIGIAWLLVVSSVAERIEREGDHVGEMEDEMNRRRRYGT